MPANLKALTALISALALSSLTGCKLAVIVIEGGQVESVSSGTCGEGEFCLHHIRADDFTETFTAVPDNGWEFKEWQAGSRFFCIEEGQIENPVCTLTNVGASANPVLASIIASERLFFIMPIFTKIEGGPTSISGPNGREWAQPEQFRGLTFAEIDAICPFGFCTGMLNGLNMDGWIWASPPDIVNLFENYTGVSNTCNTACVNQLTPNNIPGLASGDGFITWLDSGVDHLGGLIYDGGIEAYAGAAWGGPTSPITIYDIGGTTQHTSILSQGGAWFYRDN